MCTSLVIIGAFDFLTVCVVINAAGHDSSIGVPRILNGGGSRGGGRARDLGTSVPQWGPGAKPQ